MIKNQALFRKIVILSFILCLTACGYRGALYLPDEKPANQQNNTESQPTPESERESE